ncbi:MAG TPA: hypothetical protein ACFYEM_10080 [Candidatus Hypogeohydataceae bacterium YC40]
MKRHLSKKIESGAYAELETAYLVRKAGYKVSFSSPKAPASNPDLIAWINGQKINIEIIFLQRPTGGRMKLTEVDRIKRAIDNKSRQLPSVEPGIIVLYSQQITIRDLQRAVHQIQERLSRYPYIKALVVIKDFPGRDRSKDLSTNLPQFWTDLKVCPYIVSLKETDEFLRARTRFNNFTRYTFIVKGIDLKPHLLDGLKKVFMATSVSSL